MAERQKQGTVLGSLYPFIRVLAEESTFDLSFLNGKFTDLEAWKGLARQELWRRIPEKVQPCDFREEIVETVDKGDYIRQKVYFDSTPVTRVPAYVLIPKNVRYPVPGLVCFHDHGGMYYWGKEKIVEIENEHPVLTKFKEASFGGRSFATEFCRAGFAVIVIDALYWGQRRLVSDEDIDKGINDWSLNEDAQTLSAINKQCGAGEDMVARAMYQLGHTWQGIWLRDDIRSLDYLLSRKEVDPERIGCVGLSMGGFRSGQLAGMDRRIQCAVVDGWMTTYAEMYATRPRNTHYPQYITGAYGLMDHPDIVSMCCPNPLMVIHGRKDKLFTAKGVADAYARIQAVYDKAGCPDRCKLSYYDAPHEFNVEQQGHALEWLRTSLMR